MGIGEACALGDRIESDSISDSKQSERPPGNWKLEGEVEKTDFVITSASPLTFAALAEGE
jgi:hypothetical protein